MSSLKAGKLQRQYRDSQPCEADTWHISALAIKGEKQNWGKNSSGILATDHSLIEMKYKHHPQIYAGLMLSTDSNKCVWTLHEKASYLEDFVYCS